MGWRRCRRRDPALVVAISMSRKSTCNTKAGRTGGEIFSSSSARCRTQGPRAMRITPAADDAPIAVSRCPGTAVVGRTDVGVVPTVFRPLGSVSRRIKKPERIWVEASDRSCLPFIPPAAAPVAISIVAANGISPPISGPCPGAHCVFQLSLARQSVQTAGAGRPTINLAVQPVDVSSRILPTHADNGIVRRLCKSRIAPIGLGRHLRPATRERATLARKISRRTHKGFKFGPGYRIFRKRERPGDAHGMLRLLSREMIAVEVAIPPRHRLKREVDIRLR